MLNQKNKMAKKTNKTPVQIGNDATKSAMLLAAALALPAINIAHAETAPEHGVISFKYLDYLDSQSGHPDVVSGASSSTSKDRIKVKAQSLMIMAPIAGEWSVSGSYTGDSISGASPAYHSTDLRKIDEQRDAGSLGLTKYLPRGTVSIGVNQSNEHDYFSRGFSLQGTVASEDKNTTFNTGIAVSNDEINASNHLPSGQGQSKHVTDWLIGVTQVLTVNDIVQLDLGYSAGNGYFTDPYKTADKRPSSKDHYTILTRWNHYFNQTGGSSHLGYRYYNDTYGIEAHTLTAEYIQPFGNGWSVMPLARLYTQTAANFYVGLSTDAPDFPNPNSLKYFSMDQRLSEYGAMTWGFKLAKQLNPDWLVDFKYEQYKQKESWALTGNNDGNLDSFVFRSFQFGISRRF